MFIPDILFDDVNLRELAADPQIKKKKKVESALRQINIQAFGEKVNVSSTLLWPQTEEGLVCLIAVIASVSFFLRCLVLLPCLSASPSI